MKTAWRWWRNLREYIYAHLQHLPLSQSSISREEQNQANAGRLSRPWDAQHLYSFSNTNKNYLGMQTFSEDLPWLSTCECMGGDQPVQWSRLRCQVAGSLAESPVLTVTQTSGGRSSTLTAASKRPSRKNDRLKPSSDWAANTVLFNHDTKPMPRIQRICFFSKSSQQILLFLFPWILSP